jgi:ABC-type transport system involved in multi-copper enzyme maturation permease subunit
MIKFTPKIKAISWLFLSLIVYLGIDYKANFDYSTLLQSDISEVVLSIGAVILISLVCGFILLLILNRIIELINTGSSIAVSKTKSLSKSASNLSKKLQKDNTRRTLERLLKAMKFAEENVKINGGKMLLKDQERVTKIQKQLLTDMIGPATKAELKKDLFDPMLNDENNSKLIKDGLNHVLKNYIVRD